LPPSALRECGRRDDWNAAKRVHGEQVGISAHNQIGVAVNGQLQEFVVLRIAQATIRSVMGTSSAAASTSASQS
jgi:hypothetical protein